MLRWKVFYRGDQQGGSWQVTARTRSEAILAVGNSEGPDVADLDARNLLGSKA